MRNRRAAIFTLLFTISLLALTPAALAQDVPPAPTPTPAPAPVKARITLSFSGLTKSQVLGGNSWTIKGKVSSFVAGQSVTVEVKRAGRKLFTRTRYASAGDRGLAVSYLQSRLARLGYVVGRRGSYDARTARAVLAFRKITRMARTQVATSEVFSRLEKGWGRFKVRYKDHGRHIEVDLTHQVIALISRGKAVRIYPISSGKASTPTILGNFSVYRKEPGTNSLGMIYSSYFIRGYAFHGFVDVPVYPASHGCLRIPPPDAVSVYNWIKIGTRVDTYYR